MTRRDMIANRIRPGVRRFFRLSLGRRDIVRADVDEEIHNHLTMLAEELIRMGIPEDAARREAERRFGPLDARRAELHRLAELRRQSREIGDWWWGIRQDFRFALRNVRRSPGFAIVATLILGLGIGVTTAAFSVFDSVLLRPLPFRDPSHLVVIWETARDASSDLSAGVFDNSGDADEWAARTRSFDGIAEATWARGPQVYRPGSGPPRQVLAIPTSANLFDVLGVHAELGRTFSRDDILHGCAVVLSHTFWRSAFGGEPGLIGRTITLNDTRCAIVGVMPASFEFYPRATELWSLMTPVADTMLARHAEHYLVGVFARLRRGVTASAAQHELRDIQASTTDATPFHRDFVPTVFDLQKEFTWLAGRNLRTTLAILLGAVGLVLLVVCVNVANLSLGRAVTRGQEFAVRVAIGAGRWRLIRQLLAESATIACLGAVVGLGVAVAALRYVNAGKAMELPPGGTARLDLVALTATMGMTLVATIVVGIVPALRATRVNTADALKSTSGKASGGRHSSMLANALVVCQVSVSVTLLVGAALLLQSLERFGSAPLGYSPDHLLTAHVSIASSDTLAIKRAFGDALARVLATPRVVNAAWTSVVPVAGRGDIQSVVVERGAAARTDSLPDVGVQEVNATYFSVMRVPLVAGRDFGVSDDPAAPPVALVNRAFVDRYIAGANAVGRRIRVGDSSEPWITIVGVVGNEQRTMVTREMSWVSLPMVFRPLTQSRVARSMTLVVRASADDPTLVQHVRGAVTSATPDAIVSDVATMHELLDRFLASPRARAEALAALALLGLTLAVIGLYGLLSQLVAHRTREIGIRVALGARASQVIALIVGRGAALTATGVALGCGLAIPATQTMHSLLYGVTTLDPLTFVVVGSAMIATAVIASLVPARRAARIDPMIALRSD